MPKTKLKSIELTYFRGATLPVKIEFSPDKKVTLIYGENGSGKSSVVDAFDFVCAQDFGSLGIRKGADTDLLTAINGKSDQVRVQLATDSASWEASFKPSSKTIVVKPNSSCPDVRILRRSNILRLIDEIPSKRFEALKEYIDVTSIEKCEKSLGEAIRNKEGELDRHIQAGTQAESSLNQIWVAEKSPGKSAEQWAEGESLKDTSKLQEESDEVGSLLTTITNLQQFKTSKDRNAGLVEAATSVRTAAQTKQKDEEGKVLNESPGVLEVLRNARTFIDGRTETMCPVCLQPKDSKKLAEELDKRISAMAALASATSKAKAAKTALGAASAQLANSETQLIDSADKAAKEFAASKLPPVAKATFPTSEFSQVADKSLDIPAKVAASLKILESLTSIKESLVEHRNSANKTITLKTAIGTQLKQIKDSRASQKATDDLLNKMRIALEIVGTTRKNFVKEVLDSVSSEIERLYEQLHPSESIGGIKLSLDPDNFGSLHLHGDFHSKEGVTPQSVYSESHLDTLGFCVFLALAKLYKTDDTIIILDDVLTSVDAQHLDRFINLIHDEEQHFSQIIITTHYRPWCEKYRHHRAPGNKVHFIELRPWGLQSGIRVQQMKLCLDELRQALTVPPFDRQIVASKSGIFLESMLEFLARMYECRLPLKARSGYTLGELTGCFSSKKLLPALTIERMTIQKDASGNDQEVWEKTALAPYIAKIKDWAEIRNLVGCHFSELGAHCIDKDVEELANATLALGDILVCPDGGDFPSRDNSGSYHETRSKKVRLHPFTEPK